MSRKVLFLSFLFFFSHDVALESFELPLSKVPKVPHGGVSGVGGEGTKGKTGQDLYRQSTRSYPVREDIPWERKGECKEWERKEKSCQSFTNQMQVPEKYHTGQ